MSLGNERGEVFYLSFSVLWGSDADPQQVQADSGDLGENWVWIWHELQVEGTQCGGPLEDCRYEMGVVTLTAMLRLFLLELRIFFHNIRYSIFDTSDTFDISL